ncbi:MAG: DeoR/GlpR transcriptional regulator [Eubacterium sp.]|nr:DeoR/GlpR transcriptional regulator [Eubacterium sp.]
MFAEERRRNIEKYVAERKRVTVDEICQAFSVSPATVRNDLNQLDEEGKLKRTHGGAIANTKVSFELFTAEKDKMHHGEKEAIAKEAVKLIHEGDSIALDSGTTVFELAKLLGRFKNLRVVTWDLSIAAWLDMHTQVSLFMIGGEVRKGHHYTTGYTFREFLPRLNVDLFFMSANGVDVEQGITTPQVETAMIKELILKGSRRAVLLSDSSKLGDVTFVKFADLRDIEELITDDGCNPEIGSQMQSMGVKMVIAKVPEADE